MKQNRKIILGSASPRRRELLTQAGITFTVLPSNAEENLPEGIKPEEAVLALSRFKAEDVLKLLAQEKNEDLEGSLIIGSDTVVALEGEILGKPANEEDAVNMLMKLSGKTHFVYTGLAVLPVGDKERPGFSFTEDERIAMGPEYIWFAEKTEVEMYPFSREEAEGYVATGEPMDKAGAYGIQGKGAVLVKEIRGDYNTVVGLPLARLVRELDAKFWISLTEW